ncbi:XrtY-associated glycosyltransferase XYAG1 [Mucilaginibacter achroorhodeus]
MKILHVTASYKPAYIYGGPIMSVSALCEALVENDIDVEVFTTTANGRQELSVTPGTPEMVNGVRVTYFKRITKDHTHFSPSLLKNLRAKVKDYDVVHIHAWWNLVSVFAALIATRNNMPVILSPRGTLSYYSFLNRNSFKKRLIHHLLGKKLLRNCHIHATAQSEAFTVNKLIKPLSSTVIPNFVKLPCQLTFKRTFDEASPIKLLFFSRIEEKKGLDLLLKALPKLNFQFSLTIAGTGDPEYIKSLKSLISDNNIGQQISWLGFVTDDKFDVLNDHDLLILPSYDENFGNVVIESLSVGTPVLISDKVGLADYVADKDMGWIFKINTDNLSDKLNDICALYKSKFDVISSKAPDIIRDDFNIDKLVSEYLSMYNNIATAPVIQEIA